MRSVIVTFICLNLFFACDSSLSGSREASNASGISTNDSLAKELNRAEQKLQIFEDSIIGLVSRQKALAEKLDSLELLQLARIFYHDYIEVNSGPPFYVNKHPYYSLKLKEYEKELAASKLFTDNFIEAEIQRYRPCAKSLEYYTIPASGDTLLPEPCALLSDSTNRWYKVDKESEGVIIEILGREGTTAQVSLEPYYYSKRFNEYVRIASLNLTFKEVEEGKWLIDEFKFDGYIL